MAHESLEPHDHGPYKEGSAFDIKAIIKDADGVERVNIGGATAEFRVKEEMTDADTDALLEKTGTHGGDESEIEFVDPQNGELIIKIETDDTRGFLYEEPNDEKTERRESREFYWHIRICDETGNCWDAVDGYWMIEAS